jgi:hypothetical protein
MIHFGGGPRQSAAQNEQRWRAANCDSICGFGRCSITSRPDPANDGHRSPKVDGFPKAAQLVQPDCMLFASCIWAGSGESELVRPATRRHREAPRCELPPRAVRSGAAKCHRRALTRTSALFVRSIGRSAAQGTRSWRRSARYSKRLWALRTMYSDRAERSARASETPRWSLSPAGDSGGSARGAREQRCLRSRPRSDQGRRMANGGKAPTRVLTGRFRRH